MDSESTAAPRMRDDSHVAEDFSDSLARRLRQLSPEACGIRRRGIGGVDCEPAIQVEAQLACRAVKLIHEVPPSDRRCLLRKG
eukprot:1527869-Rhodomonas_salina.2